MRQRPPVGDQIAIAVDILNDGSATREHAHIGAVAADFELAGAAGGGDLAAQHPKFFVEAIESEDLRLEVNLVEFV